MSNINRAPTYHTSCVSVCACIMHTHTHGHTTSFAVAQKSLVRIGRSFRDTIRMSERIIYGRMMMVNIHYTYAVCVCLCVSGSWAHIKPVPIHRCQHVCLPGVCVCALVCVIYYYEFIKCVACVRARLSRWLPTHTHTHTHGRKSRGRGG